MSGTSGNTTMPRERADLLESLATQRAFLRQTVHGLTDEQARLAPTASELCLGGLIKHVAATERGWVEFIQRGPVAMELSEEAMAAHAEGFRMGEHETLAGILDDYDKTAQATDELLVSLPDLDAEQPLPEAPWFPPGSKRSARRVFAHLIGEIAQHSGHADIIRETIDGAKTMG